MQDVFFRTLIMSMTPVIELRGAIPFGLTMGLDPVTCYIAAVIGNSIPIPFIIFLIERVFLLMRQMSPTFGALADKLERRAAAKSDVVKKYAMWGLVLLVAIPLPGTGAWTGSLVAALMNIPPKKSVPACVLGVLIAGCLVMAISTGVIAIVT